MYHEVPQILLFMCDYVPCFGSRNTDHLDKKNQKPQNHNPRVNYFLTKACKIFWCLTEVKESVFYQHRSTIKCLTLTFHYFSLHESASCNHGCSLMMDLRLREGIPKCELFRFNWSESNNQHIRVSERPKQLVGPQPHLQVEGLHFITSVGSD